MKYELDLTSKSGTLFKSYCETVRNFPLRSVDPNEVLAFDIIGWENIVNYSAVYRSGFP